MNEKTLWNEIFQKVKELNLLKHEEQNDFIPSYSYIPYAGRVYDEKEIISLVDSALDFLADTWQICPTGRNRIC